MQTLFLPSLLAFPLQFHSYKLLLNSIDVGYLISKKFILQRHWALRNRRDLWTMVLPSACWVAWIRKWNREDIQLNVTIYKRFPLISDTPIDTISFLTPSLAYLDSQRHIHALRLRGRTGIAQCFTGAAPAPPTSPVPNQQCWISLYLFSRSVFSEAGLSSNRKENNY